jgi:hypothetical protein
MYQKIFYEDTHKIIDDLPYVLETVCIGDILILVGLSNATWSIDTIVLI